jgi:endonuclease G
MKQIFAICISLIFLASCDNSTTVNTVITPTESSSKIYSYVSSIHTNLGVPSDADTSDDYIIVRHQYVLSYNKNRNVCNWVASELNKTWFTDTVERYDGNFLTDNSLPSGFYKVKHDDYTNSGFDRGHMVRSEERTRTVEDNKSTFLLSQNIPQTADLNRGVWLDLEYHLEDLCKKENKELFVVAGGVFKSGKTINSKVAIPDSCFKIVVVLELGQSIKDVTSANQVIAVMMPNIDGIRTDKWEKYKTTIDNIEASTGYNFLNKISKSIQDILESK